MKQREKLIDILSHFRECMYDETVDCNECDYKDVGECCDTRLADYLLANGVVVLPCRCENCENSAGKSLVDGQTFCLLHADGFNGDDFCSYAKRKGDIVDLCTTGHLHLGYLEEKGGDE